MEPQADVGSGKALTIGLEQERKQGCNHDWNTEKPLRAL
jgi:hypothetical protein